MDSFSCGYYAIFSLIALTCGIRIDANKVKIDSFLQAVRAVFRNGMQATNLTLDDLECLVMNSCVATENNLAAPFSDASCEMLETNETVDIFGRANNEGDVSYTNTLETFATVDSTGDTRLKATCSVIMKNGSNVFEDFEIAFNYETKLNFLSDNTFLELSDYINLQQDT